MENLVLDSLAPMLMTHGGAILVAAVLPIVAFLLLDGVVALARGKGVVPLLIAAGLVIGVGGIGMMMWQGGLALLEGNPAFDATSAGAEANVKMLIGWCSVLGAFAFLIRMLKLVTRRKSRA